MAERELDDLFRAWRSEPVPPSMPAVDERGSAVVAAALRRVSEQKRRKSRVRRLGAALAVAAGLCGLGVGAWYELGAGSMLAGQGRGASVVVGARSGAVAVTDGVGHVLPDGAESGVALSEGYGVRTNEGTATLGFPSGAQATVAHESSLKITAARVNEALFLASGGVEVEVPKLDPKRGFSVETPDARVTVHGTHFTVKVESTTSGPRTHVDVAHGIVSVQHDGHEVFLTAGQSWPKAVAAEPPELAAPLAGAPEASPAGESAPDAGGEEEAAPSAPADGSQGKHGANGHPSRRKLDSRELADLNERFARAMTLKKNGEPQKALRVLDKLARRYPGSPLAQELRVERLRLLRAVGRSRAASIEAARYLREYPNGYAAAEARELVPERP
jgi:ferric-dicitrate binding protein FerR (iron transport regulator)